MAVFSAAEAVIATATHRATATATTTELFCCTGSAELISAISSTTKSTIGGTILAESELYFHARAGGTHLCDCVISHTWLRVLNECV